MGGGEAEDAGTDGEHSTSGKGPTFSGDMTDYYRWKPVGRAGTVGKSTEDGWCYEVPPSGKSQQQGEELEQKERTDLVLPSCAVVDEIFRRLDNRFGNKVKIVLRIAEKVHGLPL